MAGKADVQTHLEHRRSALEATLGAWSEEGHTALDRAAIVHQYFADAQVGDVQGIDGGSSVLVRSAGTDDKRASVLVVGSHAVEDLGPHGASSQAGETLTGPGVASRLGPTLAFCEGVQAARNLTVDEPINVSYLSVGDDDSFANAAANIFTGNLDAVFITNATNWSPQHPSVTTGCRGRILADLTLSSGAQVDDFLVSGGLRNPLTTMTHLIGTLRGNDGRIVLPRFYDRAAAPGSDARLSLQADGHDPNSWSSALPIAALGGNLSSLERASLWPGVSVLDITSASSGGVAAPASVTATIALYLVPDQRHAEIERSLRAWFESAAPADLQPAVHITDSSRPFRSPEDSIPVAAQTRAALRLFGRRPILVPAGGPAGAGEIAFRVSAPVGFAGIAPPSPQFLSSREQLSWGDFVYGVAMAAETSLQLRRV